MGSRDELDDRGAEAAARSILECFDAARSRFNEITDRARTRFEDRDWHGMMADMGERLELHSVEVDRVIAGLREAAGERLDEPRSWPRIKVAYASMLAGRRNRELAETFFNSVSRRVLTTVGKNADTEFDSEESRVDPAQENPEVYERYPCSGTTREVIRSILVDRGLRAGFEDLERDAGLAAAEIDGYLTEILGDPTIDAVEVIRSVFFRQKLAYVIGRIRTKNSVLPLVLPLRHGAQGIAVDAVLMSRSELSIIFSFTRSHFHVETECAWDLVTFLKSIMPLKPIAELYISLGFFKHGKTELYRSLRSHLRTTIDRFEFAKGDPGMVMLVFTLPFYGIVFKIIRDSFGYPKKNTRKEVIDRYRLVFVRDRVGRLVEAQEFEYLELRADQFREDVLAELLREAASTVTVRDGAVVLKHVYIERKVTPLNLHLREATGQEQYEAIRDYGDAVKELAAANIFPGDFLLKNFGVTRHGRVVFYDYDELCLMTDCNFRAIPPARNPEDELAAEPWFSVGENDIFPEEFRSFLSLPEPLRSHFEQHHGDLFDAGLWNDMKRRVGEGEIMDVYPYARSKRLRG